MKRTILILALGLAALLAGCGATPNPPTPAAQAASWNTATWDTSTWQ